MRRLPSAIGAAALALAMIPVMQAPTAAISPDVVISQVYGGGGSTTSVFRSDFVELFNRGSTPVSLTGWSVQYASATGTGTFLTPTALSGTVQPGQYYLVQESSGATGEPLPAPDATGLISMSGTAGKIALVTSTSSLGCNGGSTPCSPAQLALIKDLVGYGTANFFEGTGPAPQPSTTSSVTRQGLGCTETDTNSADFAVTTPPVPRNTASSPHSCDVPESAPTVVSTWPVDGGRMPFDAYLTVTFSEPVAVAPGAFNLVCAPSGDVPFAVSGGPTAFRLDLDVDLAVGDNCTVTVDDASVSDQDSDDPPDTMAADYTFSFAVFDPCAEPYTRISAIQGSGAVTAMDLQSTTQGVVVGDFEGNAGVNGFYLQDPVGDGDPATSDSIFVFTGTNDLVAAGQVVRVTGFPVERNGQTTITGAKYSTTVPVSAAYRRVCGTDAVQFTDLTLPFPTSAHPERYEGMLVRLPQSLVIAEAYDYARYGEIALAQPLPGEPRLFTGTALEQPGSAAFARNQVNASSAILLDDGSNASNPAVLRHPAGDAFTADHRFRLGDTVTGAVGVLGYDHGAYRLQPTGPAEVAAGEPRPVVPNMSGLRVAALNTGNYFLSAGTVCGPDGTLACRGWDEPGELTRQRSKLLAALNGLDADIVGVLEVENTTGVEPLADLVQGMPGFAYVDTGTIGTDAIKAGLLYRTEAVTPVGAFQVLDASDDPRFLDTRNRPVLAQTFEETAGGQRFTVALAHLKSKGATCAEDPDAGDGQGACNATRTDAARALVDWLATDPTGSGDPDFLVLGDLNAYRHEDPVSAIRVGADDGIGTADDFTDLLAATPFTYSYVYDGQAGYIDHALASASLSARVTDAAFWHINADEPGVLGYDTTYKPPEQEVLYAADAYRVSDHDPVLVGLSWPAPQPEPTPTPTVKPTTAPPPAKQLQTVAAPRALKKRGVTVLVPRGLRSSAGLPVTSKVTGKATRNGTRYFRIIRSRGVVKVRTYGKKGWKLVLTQTAPGSVAYEPFTQRIVYVNGKRR